MTELVDTHCHIHEAAFELLADDPTHKLWAKAANPDPDAMIARAQQNGVGQLICVGTNLPTSQQAVTFVHTRENCYASVGIHPHEAKDGEVALQGIKSLLAEASAGMRQPRVADFLHHGESSGTPEMSELSDVQKSDRPRGVASSKIVAIGEIGLDYFYSHSSKEQQIKALRFQIELALHHDLPIIFHVREAFDDFWPIFDSYKGIRGVLHSFTDNHTNFTKAMQRGLFIGINGITTFTKVNEQLQIAKEVPLQKLLLETDAPFLTPAPLRGTVNEPSHVRLVAEFLAGLRNEPLQNIAEQTTQNAKTLFLPLS